MLNGTGKMKSCNNTAIPTTIFAGKKDFYHRKDAIERRFS
jgi:hypothetical protein